MMKTEEAISILVNIPKPREAKEQKRQNDAIRMAIEALKTYKAAGTIHNEWCHECAEFNQELNICPRHNQVIEKTVKELKEELELIHCCECANLQADNLFHEFWCNGQRVTLDHYCGWARRKADD